MNHRLLADMADNVINGNRKDVMKELAEMRPARRAMYAAYLIDHLQPYAHEQSVILRLLEQEADDEYQAILAENIVPQG